MAAEELSVLILNGAMESSCVRNALLVGYFVLHEVVSGEGFEELQLEVVFQVELLTIEALEEVVGLVLEAVLGNQTLEFFFSMQPLALHNSVVQIKRHSLKSLF